MIAKALERGLGAQRIWQDLVEEYGYGGGYLTVQRYVRGLKRLRPEVADRLEHPPGEEALCGFPHSASAPGSWARDRVTALVGVGRPLRTHCLTVDWPPVKACSATSRSQIRFAVSLLARPLQGPGPASAHRTVRRLWWNVRASSLMLMPSRKWAHRIRSISVTSLMSLLQRVVSCCSRHDAGSALPKVVVDPPFVIALALRGSLSVWRSYRFRTCGILMQRCYSKR